MYVEGGKVYCLAWKVEVEEFGMLQMRQLLRQWYHIVLF
jgi:hypothetical protein